MNSYPLPRDVRLRCVGQRAFSQEQRAAVDALWTTAPEGYFPGTVCSLVGHTSEEILCELVPFAAVYAHDRSADIRAMFSLAPLGVSGRTCCGGEILTAVRDRVAWHAGCRECVPSGGVDSSCLRPDGTVDICQAVLTELVEETGWQEPAVRDVCPRALYQDGYVWDIQVDIVLEECMRGRPIRNASHEYTAYLWVTPLMAQSMMDSWVPLSQQILRQDI